MPSTENASRDEALMRQVAQGSTDALGLLHRRFARPIFALAVQTLDRAAAEDLVQEVFLLVWRNAARFDPERGTVRSWILQIAHFRLLNELRRRSRQPEIVSDPDGFVLEGLAAHDLGPAEAASQQRRRAIIQSAVDELPLAQRQALSLAFLDDLTHEQVAAELGLPLGTAKTRIRSGLQKLRGTLAPHWAALAALSVLAVLGIRYWSEQATLARYDRALSMVTASDSVNLRLAPAPGTPLETQGTHARYRGRPGATTAVVTLSRFPAAPAGQTYQVWARHGTSWTSLGTVQPDADGSGRLIAESPELALAPDGVEVTLEPRAASATPSATPGARVIVAWSP